MGNIRTYTDSLMGELDKGYQRFMENERPERNRTLFEMVKQQVDPVLDTLDAWELEALHMIQTKEISLHPKQVDATCENMKAFLMHSFYKDTRKRKFIEIYKSCTYIFSHILKELS